jgi:glutathione synthase/RimK-type ligase-like ATP-grasp enzyme
MKDCDALMWHHSHAIYKDVITAKKILFALEHAGIIVFPDFKTGWHFDDKVAQKYLLEAVGAPLVPSYVFYDKKEALNWADSTSFPKVFKLKGGAGAANVKLVRTKVDAVKLINKAFGKGFSQFNKLVYLKEKYRKYKEGKSSFFGFTKGFACLFISNEYAKQQANERGYVYFQEFIPNNTFDTRLVLVADKAAAERRIVRENDFRASGSGQFSYDKINVESVKIAFVVSKQLNMKSVAFDFIEDEKKNPLIVEMSYGFGTTGINNAPGYWDSSLHWHAGQINPQEWMVEELVNEIRKGEEG